MPKVDNVVIAYVIPHSEIAKFYAADCDGTGKEFGREKKLVSGNAQVFRSPFNAAVKQLCEPYGISLAVMRRKVLCIKPPGRKHQQAQDEELQSSHAVRADTAQI